MKRIGIVLSLILVLFARPSFISTQAQSSISFSVTTTVDAVDANIGDGVCQTAVPGQCTLRAAIQEGNVFAGQVFISVNNAGGPMGLSIAGTGEDAAASGDLDITGDIRIGGPGTADGNDIDRVFHVHSGGQLDLLSVHVTDGFVLGAEDGGAVLVSGVGSSLEVTFAQISAHQSADRGGALRVENGAFAEIRSASFSENSSAGPGGAISVNQAGLTLKNVTLYDNSAGASSSGGGIAIQNSIADVTVDAALKVVSLNNVTIADNSAGSPGGGGLTNFGDIYATVSNSAFSNNTATGGNPNCTFSGTGVTKAFTSAGNNLANNATGCFTVNPVDLQAAPGLAAAAPINGVTHLKPASAASAVVNNGGTFSCEPSDAVGNLRPQGSGCDIGAMELAVGFAGSISATSIAAIGQSVTVTVQDADLRFSGSIAITAQTIVNGLTFETESLTLNDVEFNDIFTGTFPVRLNSVPAVGNGILDIIGEGMIRFTYSDTPNGVSEAGVTVRTFETQVTGFQDDIIANSSFELHTVDDKLPDGWKAKNLSKDKLRCNTVSKTFAVDGLCAFEMKNTVGTLSQKLALPLPANIDDDMFFEVLVNTNVARPGVIASIVIKESDGDKEKCEINLLAGTNNGAGGYESYQCNIEPDLEEVISIKIKLFTPGIGTGKILFDRVSLLTIVPRDRSAGTNTTGGLLPPPAPPSGFRR